MNNSNQRNNHTNSTRRTRNDQNSEYLPLAEAVSQRLHCHHVSVSSK